MTYTLRCDEVGLSCGWTSEADSSDAATNDFISHLHEKHQIDRPSRSLQEYLNRHVDKHEGEPPVRDSAFGTSVLAEAWPAAVIQKAQARLRMRGNPNG